MSDFTERLKELRKEKGVSLDKVAATIDNITKASLSNYEKGKSKPGISIAIKLADYFNCSLDYLTGRSDIKYAEAMINTDFEDTVKDFNELLNLYENLTHKKIKSIHFILDEIKKFKDLNSPKL